MPLSSVSQFELLQHIPLGICTVNDKYTVLSWNKPLQNWTDTEFSEVAGKNLLELYPHLNIPRYKSRFDLAFEGGAPYVFSPQLHPHFFPSVLPNGQRRIQRTTVASHVVAGDRRVLIICVQDVTNMMDQLQTIQALQRISNQEAAARKQALQELEEANRHLVEYSREKDRIMQILSHDLRSPLSGIKAAAELISSSPANEELASEFSTMISRVSDTLIELINDFLDLARANDGKVTLNQDYWDMREIATRSVEVISMMAAGKGIGITTFFPEKLSRLARPLQNTPGVYKPALKCRKIYAVARQCKPAYRGRGHRRCAGVYLRYRNWYSRNPSSHVVRAVWTASAHWYCGGKRDRTRYASC